MFPTRSTLRPAAAPPQSDVGARLPGWEAAFIVVALLTYWTDLLRIAFPGELGGEPSMVFRATHFAFYGAFLALILRRPGLSLAGLARVPALVVVLALPLVSALWSINPQETFQRAIAVMGSSLFGVYLATQIERQVALRLVAIGATLAALISLALILAVPSIGIAQDDVHAGSWTGAYGHKNGLGLMSSLGAFVCLLVAMDRGSWMRPLAAGGLALNVLILLGSRSLTGQLTFALSVATVLFIGRFIRFIARHAVAVGVAVAVPILIAALMVTGDDFVALVEVFGRDASFSNRIPIWQSVWPFVEVRPWFGYGYEAFWHEEHAAVRIIEGQLRFRPWYAHNGFLEMTLAFGLLGAALVVCLLVTFIVRAARRLHDDDRNAIYFLAFVFGLVMAVQNVSESTILLRNSMLWSLFVMLYISVSGIRLPPPSERLRDRTAALPSMRRRPIVVN